LESVVQGIRKGSPILSLGRNDAGSEKLDSQQGKDEDEDKHQNNLVEIKLKLLTYIEEIDPALGDRLQNDVNVLQRAQNSGDSDHSQGSEDPNASEGFKGNSCG